MKTLSPEALRDISNMLGLNKDMEGAHQQIQKYQLAIDEITKLIKRLKANHNMKPQQIIGGNLLFPVANTDAIKDLQERKRQIGISLNGIEEQIKQRADTLTETFHKVYVKLKPMLPKDMQ